MEWISRLGFVCLALCLFIVSCEEDSEEPTPEMEVASDDYILFRGRVTEAETGDPISGLPIFASVGLLFRQTMTDEEGIYLIDIPNIQQELRDEGYPESEIFRFFSQDEFRAFFSIEVPFCEWISSNATNPLRQSFSDPELPINFQKDFSLTKSKEFDIIFVDSVGREPGVTGWSAGIEIRKLSETTPLVSYQRFDLEFSPIFIDTHCLPFNESMELTVTFSEFIRDVNNTPLGSKVLVDTLLLTGEEVGQYVISW